jgi:uncharacterized protein YfkK (UPF0435 family)
MAKAKKEISPDAKVRKALQGECAICDIALVSVIKTRVDDGETVNKVCQDLEDYQRQLGDIVHSRMALQHRFYRNHPGFNVRPNKKVKKEKKDETVMDKFDTIQKSLTMINGEVQDLELDQSQISALKDILALIFRNLEEKEK